MSMVLLLPVLETAGLFDFGIPRDTQLMTISIKPETGKPKLTFHVFGAL